MEQLLDSELRPVSWEEYIGQETIKKNLLLLVEAAKARGQMPEHILLYGSAGLGKTTLAHLVGSLLGVPIQTIAGTMIERSGDIVSIVSTLESGGVLFIDEVHRINRSAEETLYPIMESGSIDIIVGKGPTARSVHLALPPVTIIAATTQVGKLSHPLRSRFSGGLLRLQNYTDEELRRIALRSAKRLTVSLSEDAAEAIAIRARGTPRTANYLLRRVRDYAQVHEKPISKSLVHEALQDRNIDDHGLTNEDRTVLTTLKDVFNGGPVGIQALATTLAEDPQTIEEVYEPFLVHTGFIERTPRGRKLTNRGRNYLLRDTTQ